MSDRLESNVRTSHPSQAQIEILLEFLERHPALAKGYSRTQSARDRARKDWEQITLRINSIGGSTTKTWKQWMKYWSDKKSAVKKKASLRASNRNRTGGGTGEAIDLTEVEERIITLMGGEEFATGDRHLGIPLFSETSHQPEQQDNVVQMEHDITTAPSTSQNIIGWRDSDRTLSLESSPSILLENPVIAEAEASARPSICPPVIIPITQPETESGNPLIRRVPAVRYRITAPESQIPQASERTTPRRRRTVGIGSPPSQRRTQFMSVAERFLRLEEQRLELDRAQSQRNTQLIGAVTDLCENIVSQNALSSRMMVEAVKSLGDGLQKIGEGMLALSDAIQRNRQ